MSDAGYTSIYERRQSCCATATGRGAPGIRAEIALQPMGHHEGADHHAAACGGVQGGAGESDLKKAATHGEFPQEHTLGWSCRPWRGAHTRVGGLMGDAAHGGHAGVVCS